MTVLLLHGLGSDREAPLNLFGPLVPEDERIVAPDVRAHGGNPLLGTSAELDVHSLADELAGELVSSGRPEPLTIIGISMGAAIGLRLCLDPRLVVSDAVFVRPSFTGHGLPANLAAYPVIARYLSEYGAVEGERAFRRTGLYARTAAESPLGGAGLLQQFRAPDAVRRAIRLLEIPRSRAFDSEDELREVSARTAVVAAPRDPVHPVAIARQWAAGLRSAPLWEVPARDDGSASQTAALRRTVAERLGWPLPG